MSSLTRWINPKERKEINPLTTKQDARFIIKRFAGHFLLVSGDYSHKTNKLYYADFFASSKNFARPISVNGCFSNPKIDSNGEVTTSAPASAHLII